MMLWTTTARVGAVMMLLGLTVAGPAVAGDFLSVAANAPAVPLEPRNPGRDFVWLPTLEYLFEIHTQCSDSRSPESLSLNVADTRASLHAAKIASDGPTKISLNIPASQIAPLVVEDFCILPIEENGDGIDGAATQIIIPGALSAQASLLCAGDADKAMTYVSKALAVSLVCDRQSGDKQSGVE